MQKILFLVLTTLLFINGCKEEEETPVEPSVHGTISGVIIEENTHKILSNVNVFSEPATSFVTTDANGEYKIFTVEPGEYKMFAYKNTYDTMTVNITVVADANSVADFTMRLTDSSKTQIYGSIEGTVRNKADDTVIPSVSIRTEPVTSIISTDAEGNFNLKNVLPGEYTVYAEKANFDTLFTKVTVTVGQSAIADFYLPETDTTKPVTVGSISGSITEAVSGNSVSGAIITTDPSTESVISDTNGEYQFKNVPPEEYILTVAKSTYQLATTKVTVVAGNDTNADIVLIASTGGVEGIITNAITVLPLAGVIVTTDPATSSVTSDAEGKYSFENLSPGTYKILTQKNDYISAELSVVINAGRTTNADIAMQQESE